MPWILSGCWLPLLVGLLVGGCSLKPHIELQGVTSMGAPPLSLKVGQLSFEKQSLPETQATNRVESLLVPHPSVVVEQWFRDRFVATGGEGRGILTLDNLEIREEPLAKTGDWFRSKSIKYTCILGLRLQILGGDGASQGTIYATSSASHVVPDILTVSEREKVWLCLVETALNDADRFLEAKIKSELAAAQ